MAATRNNARVRELADDAELVAWLAANGLSAEEAGEIQPEYCWIHPEDPGCEQPAEASRDDLTRSQVAVGSMAALLGAGGAVWNALPGLSERGGAWRSVVGLGSGVLCLALGVPRLNDGGEARLLGIVDAGMGAASFTFAALRLVAGPRAGVAESASTAPVSGVSLTPLVIRGPSGSAKVGLSLRF